MAEAASIQSYSKSHGIDYVSSIESWQFRGNHFDVNVRTGKYLDVTALKGATLQSILDYSQFLKSTAAKLYAADSGRRKLSNCPCCDEPVDWAMEVLRVFGVSYRQCCECQHVFVAEQPAQETLNAVFAESDEHSSTYTDKKTLEVRLDQVIKPKLEWVVNAFEREWNRRPINLLDVGAGAGHFIEGCRRAGLRAQGYELSRSSRAFAKDNFGIDLVAKDFLAADLAPGQFDVLTMWGLLEYLPDPQGFLKAAYRCLARTEGMLIVEVPRFDSVSTAVQQQFPETIARHLDPTSHMNCFSDTSIVSALVRCGFRPAAAWYFGMDAYELLVQQSLNSDVDLLSRFSQLIPSLQATLDRAKLCDDLIIAAIPDSEYL